MYIWRGNSVVSARVLQAIKSHSLYRSLTSLYWPWQRKTPRQFSIFKWDRQQHEANNEKIQCSRIFFLRFYIRTLRVLPTLLKKRAANFEDTIHVHTGIIDKSNSIGSVDLHGSFFFNVTAVFACNKDKVILFLDLPRSLNVS